MNEAELRIEAIRASHEVKLVDGDKEGTSITSVPNGTFGYTYSPDWETGAPIFRRKAYRSFEMHRNAGGEIFFVGYVTPAEAERIESGDDFLELNLYPDPFEGATDVVSIAISRVVNRNLKALRIDGNPLPLKVGPAK